MLRYRKLMAFICSLTLISSIFPLSAVAVDVGGTSDDISESNEFKSTTTMVIWYKNIEQSDIRSLASEKANEYEDSFDRTKYTPTEIEKLKTDYYKSILRELTSKAHIEQAEKVLSELGIDKTKASYSVYTPVIICELTDEQLKVAESSELISSVSPYEPLDNIDDATVNKSPKISEDVTAKIESGTDSISVVVNYSGIDSSALYSEASQKANEYEDTLDKEKYSITEIEKLKTDYYKAVLLELTSKAYTEQAEKVLAELGIDKANASYSSYTPMIICELTGEQIKSIEDCEYISSVTLYEPLVDEQAATDSIELTTFEGVSVLPGDANCDFEISLSDAVAILQFIANGDKYPLANQAKINADCYDPGSGVTAMDALSIQKYDTKVINNLPEFIS